MVDGMIRRLLGDKRGAVGGEFENIEAGLTVS